MLPSKNFIKGLKRITPIKRAIKKKKKKKKKKKQEITNIGKDTYFVGAKVKW